MLLRQSNAHNFVGSFIWTELPIDKDEPLTHGTTGAYGPAKPSLSGRSESRFQTGEGREEVICLFLPTYQIP